MYDERVRGFPPPRVWHRRRHAGCSQVLRGCVTDVGKTDKLHTLLATCCSGWRRRRRRRLCSRITLRPLPPLFSASTWNVHVATLNGDDRTRRRDFAALVDRNHPSCSAPSSHCSRMRPRRRRHCCRMHVASRRQSISRCPLRLLHLNAKYCSIYSHHTVHQQLTK